ncbi:MAG: glycosyltransferase family 2 protein [Betaproteobacteria bacterium]|nr:glycosyltransferase family 2 protein [Betaproteobacteria bacterium]
MQPAANYKVFDPLSSQPLSVVIVTKNAATQLAACLDSASFADEMLVIDSGSSDGTAELAAQRGARVMQKEWLGFGRQKQFAVEAARHDWVLCLDADERVSEPLRASILAALAMPAARAYAMARCNRFMGRWLRHGEGYPDWSLRLFDRRHARWSDDPVHEKVLTEAPVTRIGGDLLHDSAETLEGYLNKQNRYTSLQAEALFKAGTRAGVAQLLLSPLLRFAKFYFLRLGFLDGTAGLVHIAIGCCNSFHKYAKLMALQRGS